MTAHCPLAMDFVKAFRFEKLLIRCGIESQLSEPITFSVFCSIFRFRGVVSRRSIQWDSASDHFTELGSISIGRYTKHYLLKKIKILGDFRSNFLRGRYNNWRLTSSLLNQFDSIQSRNERV